MSVVAAPMVGGESRYVSSSWTVWFNTLARRETDAWRWSAHGAHGRADGYAPTKAKAIDAAEHAAAELRR